MFPYKSAVGFFVIQILKALALIKAGRIYPVSCYTVGRFTGLPVPIGPHGPANMGAVTAQGRYLAIGYLLATSSECKLRALLTCGSCTPHGLSLTVASMQAGLCRSAVPLLSRRPR